MLNATERISIFGPTSPEVINACLKLHGLLLRKLRAAVDALGESSSLLLPLLPPRTAVAYLTRGATLAGVEAADPTSRPGPLSPEKGPTAAEAAAALHHLWLSSMTDISWQLSTPLEAEAMLALATVPPPSQNAATIEHAEAIQQCLRRAASKAQVPFACDYTSTCGKVWCSRGTAGAQAGLIISIWRPSLPEGWVYFGDFAHPGEKRPPNSAAGMLIAPEGGENAGLFVKPLKFERVWGVPKGVNKNILWVWRPVPPSDEYLLRGICIHNKSHNFHLILGLNYVYIFPGVGT